MGLGASRIPECFGFLWHSALYSSILRISHKVFVFYTVDRVSPGCYRELCFKEFKYNLESRIRHTVLLLIFSKCSASVILERDLLPGF
jgi:hypothetical protein